MPSEDSVRLRLERRLKRERIARAEAEQAALQALQRAKQQRLQIAAHSNELQAALSESKRAEALRRDFVNVAAHVLRTPMTPLMIRLYRLQGQVEGDTAETVEGVVQSVNRLNDIVNDLVRLGHLEAGGLPVNLGPHDLHSWCDSQPRVRNLPPDGALAMAIFDPARLTEILEIILRAEGNPTSLDLNIRRDGPNFVLEIPSDAHTPSSDELTALGMTSYLADGLARAMGGSVASNPGVSGVWTVTLPAVDSQAGLEPANGPALPERRGEASDPTGAVDDGLFP